MSTTEPTAAPLPVRILIVDDHPFLRDGLIVWIGRQPNFAVCGHTDSSGAATEAIRELQPTIVLLDLQLRTGSGFDVLNAVKAARLNTRIIILTNNDDPNCVKRALSTGASGYVLKQDISDVLLVAIRTALAGGIYLSPAIAEHGPEDPSKSNGSAEHLSTLGKREFQVLSFLGQGQSTKEIALQLGLSAKTIEFYRETLKKKLGVPDSLALIRMATIWAYEGRLAPRADIDAPENPKNAS
ncbi:MAG: response regulator transcription factor [Opitutus sp.]